MTEKARQFFFGDRSVWLEVTELLSAPAEVVVNAANGDLSRGEGLCARIHEAAGEPFAYECQQLVREHGHLDSGIAVPTTAGHLPYKAVIHAVGPRMGEGDEQHKIEQAVSRSLLLCETNGWHSIALPPISTGAFGVPVDTCARAFFRAVTSFWDARDDTAVEKVLVCLTEPQLPAFLAAFGGQGGDGASEPAGEGPQQEPEGHIELTDEDIAELDGGNDDIAAWFK